MARTASAPRTAATSPLPAILLAAALVIVGALAGCTTRDGASDLRLDHDGNADDTHSDTAVCDDRGRMNISGTLLTGNLVVTVTDGNNQTIFERTLNDTFKVEDIALTGAPGPWELEASREDNFGGHYQIRIWCTE